MARDFPFGGAHEGAYIRRNYVGRRWPPSAPLTILRASLRLPTGPDDAANEALHEACEDEKLIETVAEDISTTAICCAAWRSVRVKARQRLLRRA